MGRCGGAVAEECQILNLGLVHHDPTAFTDSPVSRKTVPAQFYCMRRSLNTLWSVTELTVGSCEMKIRRIIAPEKQNHRLWLIRDAVEVTDECVNESWLINRVRILMKYSGPPIIFAWIFSRFWIVVHVSTLKWYSLRFSIWCLACQLEMSETSCSYGDWCTSHFLRVGQVHQYTVVKLAVERR